ncbi:protein phosphatase 2C domain-containing protein [Myxococcota bacterium]|nr:protein phosphatase 2C domain-containing protein [Myxococcota bacterium]
MIAPRTGAGLALAITRRGAGHALNDDRYALLDARNLVVRGAGRGVLYAAADGVTSAGNGFAAAELACEALAELFTSSRAASEELLIDLIESADAQVRLTTSSACTLAGIWMSAGQGRVFCLGDTAVLRWQKGKLTRLTPKQVRGRGLAAYVGMGGLVRHALFFDRLYLQPEDVFIIATDGLLHVVPEEELATLLEADPSPAAIIEQVHGRLHAAPVPDDATFVVCRVDNPYGFPMAPARRG